MVKLVSYELNKNPNGTNARSLVVLSFSGVNICVIFLYQMGGTKDSELISTAVSCFEKVSEGGMLARARTRVLEECAAGYRTSRDVTPKDCPTYFAIRAKDNLAGLIAAWHEKKQIEHLFSPEKGYAHNLLTGEPAEPPTTKRLSKFGRKFKIIVESEFAEYVEGQTSTNPTAKPTVGRDPKKQGWLSSFLSWFK